MSDFLNKHLVLVLNKFYIPIGTTTIKQAIISLNSKNKQNEEFAAKALDLEYIKTGDNFNFLEPTYFNCLEWKEWAKLPIRAFDIPIHTPHLTIRSPIVIITNYTKIPIKRIKLSKRAIYKLYNGICIWSGKQISLSAASLEHLIPKSLGGKSDFTNIGLSDAKLNRDRGNKLHWQYKPKYKLKQPLETPVSLLIDEAIRPEWAYFLIKNKQK